MNKNEVINSPEELDKYLDKLKNEDNLTEVMMMLNNAKHVRNIMIKVLLNKLKHESRYVDDVAYISCLEDIAKQIEDKIMNWDKRGMS